MPNLGDDLFLERFESAQMPLDDMHHREHIKIAYLYLQRYPLNAAIERIRTSIKSFNAAYKVQEAPTSGYHETMTQAWMRLVHVTLCEYGPAANADEFYERSPQLSQKKILRLYYSADRFMSARAKTEFVEPDLAPLPTSSNLFNIVTKPLSQ